MTRKKAKKLLSSWKESLQFDRDRYVSIMRDKREMMDINLAMYNYKTPREHMLAECLEEIKNDKEQISYLQRIAL